ncbi:MAG: hypothetical protein ACAF42_04170 [Limnothrix sp. BL-A-16]
MSQKTSAYGWVATIGWVMVAGCAVQAEAPRSPQSSPMERSPQSSPEQQSPTPSPIAANIPIVPPDGANPWPAEWEAAYQARGRALIAQFANPKTYGNGYFENEKKSYPKAMLDFLAGNRDRAIAFLQKPDPIPSSTEHTLGIDFYPAFTLKGQVRKYFYFGQFLDPAYRDRMKQGAALWTKLDPLKQFFSTPQPFWNRSRDNCITWVDCRNTDNLRSMRETAVYLFAMEAGNRETAAIYRDRLQSFARNLYKIGQGEWDSETYWGHTFTAWLNLYDFAPEPEMRATAKAALDWLSITGALKYWRGGFGGPSKRDASKGNAPLTALASKLLNLYFGEAIAPDPDPDPDGVHALTSGYRPPAVAVALARKRFDRPQEVFAGKPTYEHWKPGARDRPLYYETLYFGRTFQLGSLAQGSINDVNGFKLLATNPSRGVDYLLAGSGVNPETISTHHQPDTHDAIGQFGPLLVWLNDGRAPFQWSLPQAAASETAQTAAGQPVLFWQLAETWIAIYPIGLTLPQVNNSETTQLQKRYPTDQLWVARPDRPAGTLTGWAMEVGEPGADRNFAAFRAAVLGRSRWVVNQNTVTFTGSQGNQLAVTQRGPDRPVVKRNGETLDWGQFAAYRSRNPARPDRPLITQDWEGGILRVIVGDQTWTGSAPDR